jgi:uncharacterized repeat protein (TIGR03803 family)
MLREEAMPTANGLTFAKLSLPKIVCVALAFCAATAIGSPAQTLTTLVYLNPADGNYCPDAPLVQGTNGNFYGTTSGCFAGFGSIFEVTPSGTLTTLHAFDGYDGIDPDGLVQATDGNFYGTTLTALNGPSEPGSVFKITPSGTFTNLYNFCSQPNCTDGSGPGAGLIQGTDLNFYGTTSGGGANGKGTVFKITPSGELTTLHSFCPQYPCADGAAPSGALVQGTDANLYGTTQTGGAYDTGTVFRITPGGEFTTLYSFCGPPSCTIENWNPGGGLVQASDGNFYGTSGGGGSYLLGTVFKMTPGGTLTNLHSFDSADGAGPNGGLVQATDGNFYGTTSIRGQYGGGTLFKITPGGMLTTLNSFYGTEGTMPQAGLLQATDGNFYGTNTSDGQYGGGSVFRLSVGLGPFVAPEPTSGSSGAPIIILGTNLTGATSVTFNGTPATFTVVSPSEITTNVPAGATTGTVQVTTPGGVLSSNVPFQVTYSLTVSTSGNGTVTSTDGLINCPGTCNQSYPSNTRVTLNATPAAGWAFSGWSGACSGTGSCVVDVTQNLSVGASFTQLSFALTVSTVGSGAVTSTDGFINCPGTCIHTYLSNTQVTLNSSPGQGWIFSGWTGACSGVGPCDLTMTANLELTAVFVEPGHGLQLTAVTPCRLVDTRQTGGPIQGGTSRSFTVPQLGSCNIPAAAAVYSLNVTVVPHGHLGYLTIWPTGEAQPVVSTMNSPDGRTKANAAIVPAGNNGAVSVYVSNTSDVILDIDGYFTAPASGTYQFYPLTPCRLVDTRGTDGELGGPRLVAQTPRSFPLLMSSCIPAGLNPNAYSLNFTVIPNPLGQRLGYLTVWPSGEPQPTVSTLNNPTATLVANAAIVPAGTGGAVDVYPSNTTDLLIDIDGYFAPAGTGGLSMYPAAPCRVLDTRQNNGPPFMGEKNVNVVGSACAPPSNAAAYIFNATVVPPASMPFLTLWPDGENQPTVSTLNALDGFITSNMAIVPTTNGSIDAYVAGLTQLLLDISGYFAP